MNPNNVIRPWLLIAGKPYGINHAYDYRLADAETATHKMYYTYRLLSSLDAAEGASDLSTATDYDVTYNFQGEFITRIQIDLWHSQNGLEEMAAAILVAKQLAALRMLWKQNACAFNGLVDIVNLTDFENEAEIIYHQQMMVTFTENISVVLDGIGVDEYVEQVDLNLETGGPTYEITRTGITVT